MYQAVWNDVVLAESDETIRLEGNHYFPPESLKSAYPSKAPMTSQRPWKGTAFWNCVRVVQVQQDGAPRENPFVALCRRIKTRK